MLKRLLVATGLLGSLVVLPSGAVQAATGTWHEVTPPLLLPIGELTDLAVAAPGEVWVSGYQGLFCIPDLTGKNICAAGTPGTPFVERRNGPGWQSYPIKGAASQGGMDVHAYGPEVWISDARGYVGRFDGKAFQRVATPDGLSATPLSVNAAGVWVQQYQKGLYHWTGHGWTRTRLPAGFDGVSRNVKARAADTAWAMSFVRGNAGLEYHLLRWDGNQWTDETRIPSPGDHAIVLGFDVAPSGEIWAFSDTSVAQTDPSRIFRYKDGSWTEIPGPAFGEVSTLSVDGAG